MARRRVTDEPETTPTETKKPDLEPSESQKAAFKAAGEKAEEFAKAAMADHKAREEAHSQRNGAKQQELTPTLPISASVFKVATVRDEKETVTATWGEELFTPRQFCSFRVGPFTGVTVVQPGETRVQAGARLYEELKALAEMTRAAKHKGFIAALRDVFNDTQAAERSS